jgi:hypothetical protein
MINTELLDTILLEWSYRLKDGIPDVNDSEKVKVLNEVLSEFNFPTLESLLLEDTTEDESETLCMYYCVVDDNTLKASREYLEKASKSKDIIIPDKKAKLSLQGYNFGNNLGNTASLTKLLDVYNEGFKASSNKLPRFVNAITSAELIRDQYGSKILPQNIDRGKDKFQAIKDTALKLLNSSYQIKLSAKEADKWSPADFMIYNGVGLKEAQEATTLNIEIKKGPKPINQLFATSITSTGGTIVGISLKQHEAQGGKALSFKSVLNKKENYPDGDALEKEDKSVADYVFNLNASHPDAMSGPTKIQDKTKIGYIKELVRLKNTVSDADSIAASADSTLKNTFSQVPISELKKFDGKAIPGTKNPPKFYQFSKEDPYSQLYQNKDAARGSFEYFKKYITQIKYSSDFVSSHDDYVYQAMIPSFQLYEEARDAFVKALKTKKYNVSATKNITIDDIIKNFEGRTTQACFKKAGCYRLATWLITGLGNESLKIPEGFSSLAAQKDPFVALTAYAIGFAGISPPFIKVIGSDTISGTAHLNEMGGDGILELDENTAVEITDSAGYQGFQCQMNLRANKVKYKTTLDFRYAGDQINIEVSKIS